MKKIDQAAILDEELRDLKLRFELLEGDRKAYYETSQWAIRRNKEEVNSLRLHNKQLCEHIAKIKKSELDTPRISMTELEKFDHKLCETQKKYDELLDDGRSKERKLKSCYDQLADLKREAEMLASNVKDSAQAKEIRMLENRLDKAMIKYNEAQSIKKTYELVVKKLQEERLTFDKQLDNFEKSLQAKQQEATELDVMSRDANHAKEVARAELAQFEQQINDERKQREKDLQLRKEMVKHKLEMAEKSDKRVTKQEEQNLEATGKEGMTQIEAASEKKLSEYSEIMRLIKEVTGVSDITEVIAKFQSQEDTHKHLNNLQVANDKKIAHLKVKREEVIKELQELRFAGEAKQSHSQNSLKEFKAHLSQKTEEFKEIKQKYDRAMKVLNSAKAGVQHLADKIESIKLSEDAPKQPACVNDDNVTEVLQLCIKKLEHLASNIVSKELPEPQAKDPNAAQAGLDLANILQVNPTLLPTHNVRVKLHNAQFEVAEADDDEDDEYGEIPDRESIKKHTAQLLTSRMKTKQPKKIKKKKAAKEDDE